MTSAHINTILTGLQDTPPAPPTANDKDEKKEKPPVIFTRLTEADHQKLMSALTSDYRRRYSPLRAHALAVAVPAEKGRKMILENARTFEYAAIQELANGAG